MTATVTTIQAAVLTALNAIGSPPTPFAARVQEVDSIDVPPTGASADVVVGFEASTRLGRTGSTILEQYLIPITIKRRYAEAVQSDMDLNHSLVEILRDSLVTYHSSTARVDHLLSPHPFDIPQSNSPGVFVNRFVLDMDVLRTTAAITQDTTTPIKTLSLVRKAAWNAISNWPEWTTPNASPFTRKYVTDQDLDELSLHDPGEFDLPAIAITWGPVSPRFFVHTAQEWPAVMTVTAWFPAHQTTLAEYTAWQLVRAIYQCAPNGSSVSYLRTATGRPPEKDSPLSIDPVELGRSQQLKALKLTIQFTFTSIVSPLTDS